MSEEEKKDLTEQSESKPAPKGGSAKKRDAGKPAGKKSAKFKETLVKVGKWFRELKSEFKKIVWPSKKQLVNNCLVVFAVLIVVGLAISLIDFVFEKGFLEGLLVLISGS